MCAERLDKEKIENVIIANKRRKIVLRWNEVIWSRKKYEIKMSSDLPLGKAEFEVKLIVLYHENEIGQDILQG